MNPSGLFSIKSVENETLNGEWVPDPVRHGLFFFGSDGTYSVINATDGFRAAHTGNFEVRDLNIDLCSIAELEGSQQHRPIEKIDSENLIFKGVGSSGGYSRLHWVKMDESFTLNKSEGQRGILVLTKKGVFSLLHQQDNRFIVCLGSYRENENGFEVTITVGFPNELEGVSFKLRSMLELFKAGIIK